MSKQKTHTFYFREKWDTGTRPQHQRVASMLRSTLAAADGNLEDVVENFLRKLDRVQTVHKMKLNSRLTAVTYRFKHQQSCEWTVLLSGESIEERTQNLQQQQNDSFAKIAAAGAPGLTVSFVCADIGKMTLLAEAEHLPNIQTLFPTANVVNTEYKTCYEYGFSTFVNHGGESFHKKKLRATALGRLEKSPQTLVSIRTILKKASRFQRHATLRWAIAEVRKAEGLRNLEQLKSASPRSTGATDASSEDGERSLDWGT